MKVNVKIGELLKTRCEIAVLGLFEGAGLSTSDRLARGFDKALQGAISKTLKSGDFKGKLNTTFLLPTYDKTPARRLLLVGLGKEKDFTLDRARQAAGTAVKAVQGLGIKDITIHPFNYMDRPSLPRNKFGGRKGRPSASGGPSLGLVCQAMAEGTILGSYRFKQFKHPSGTEEETREVEALTFIVEGQKDLEQAKNGARKGEVSAQAQCLARDLVNLPANEATPTMLARRARKMARELGLRINVLSRRDMERLGMNCLLGVSKGSAQAPQFIILQYGRKGRGDTVALVGKGVTFDSGGISLKPAQDMEKMKYDMAGVAAILGTFMALARLKPPLHIVGLLPCAENMPGGTASRPGDVLTCLGGKSVEIISTDAEGRMILADALAYARRYKPRVVIDLATLTGACVVALGVHAIGMMGTSDELKNRLSQAGQTSWERVWELPLWEEYAEQIKSDIADLKNVGGKEAGAITAAFFLSRFIEGYPWVHLDIAGTAWADKEGPYTPKGATGVGVRLLVELLTRWEKFHKK